eukprot:CAMPEP_0168556048 /NCGR_PEP_ID=MMETSP0413-20121227/8670_1 /TAXON_ID=136452 /ORGANISM="Filamoeba nolandi, Strain NC-AS-23-1" /LENGTH=681 /DNA_ID=CAMNT_0008586959 /DNA_START=162 /DNA_END=2207 /DNA_ORIENTATION=+
MAEQPLRKTYTNADQLAEITTAVSSDDEKRLYHNLIGDFPVGLYIWKMDDPNEVNSFRLKAANRYAEKFTGLQNKDIIGKTFLQVFPAGAIFPPIYLESIRTGEPHDFGEMQYKDENITEQQSYFRFRCFPLPNWTIGVLFENVSDAKQTAERRKESKKKIDELLDIVIDKFLDPNQPADNLLQTLQSMLTFAEDASTGGADNTMSISDLIKNLTVTQEGRDHKKFVEEFMISYRYFITPKALLKKLILRYSAIVSSRNPNAKTELQKIADVMHIWLKKHFYDFYNDHELLETARSFIDTWITEQLDDKVAHKLVTLIAKNIAVEETKSGSSRSHRGSISGSSATEKSSNSSESEYDFEADFKKLHFLDIDPKELSHHLTLTVFDKFKDIKPLELYNQSWSKGENKKINSPNVVALIEHFNRISNWVASVIVFTRDIRKRIQLVKYFLQVAEECLVASSDFESVFMITLGLEQFCVSRLQKTWGQVLEDSDSARIWSKLQDVISFSQNYKTYRAIYKSNMDLGKHFIPYIGLYLKDLTFIEDGNETISNDVVNFQKMSMIASIIQDIQTLQNRMFYRYKRNADLQHFVAFNLLILSEDDMYEHSKICEGLGSQTSTPVAVKRGFSVSMNMNTLRRRSVTSVQEHDTSVVIVKNPIYGVDKRKLEYVQGLEKSRRVMQKILL